MGRRRGCRRRQRTRTLPLQLHASASPLHRRLAAASSRVYPAPGARPASSGAGGGWRAQEGAGGRRRAQEGAGGRWGPGTAASPPHPPTPPPPRGAAGGGAGPGRTQRSDCSGCSGATRSTNEPMNAAISQGFHGAVGPHVLAQSQRKVTGGLRPFLVFHTWRQHSDEHSRGAHCLETVTDINHTELQRKRIV
ncbi:translation initiation factor IF-2-like [Vulpes lagopus]|uniref:translation initiation factor IF-2-like n=1 Tax=Vulpes lagopus TaxID=494514 RepID=UPI001BC9BB01|nr:translation initiation factor IF-2-like [Vulpes lagopus]